MDLNYKHYLDSMKMKQCIKKRIESVLTDSILFLFYIVTGNLSTTAFCPSNVK